MAEISNTIVASGLLDPMEITIAPDGDLFVIEREGRVLRVHPATGAMFVIGKLQVTALNEKNRSSKWAREDGMLGITVDPQFAKNQRLYIYYSAADIMANRLSRFTLKDGMLDMASEKKMLEVPTDRRDRVCHHGGSLSFGTDGLLYMSCGDNTNPFESGGVAPIDDRDGHDHANAMRSAGNTNDLRGKILRIKPTEDGYTIPAGNLFPPGTAKTRPEIFAMGCRNPFRMSLDPKTHTVYWGEVGPDAGKPSEKGPAGHDEVNQAKSAGNYGWPFVIANNKGYPIIDFNTGKSTSVTDPAAPKNPSKMNTGLTDLPPARSALIWYPYDNSQEYPLMGSGSRNAMAGPVFYYDAKRKYNILAQEDDHSLITYDWMRNKAWKVKLNDKEEFVKMEVFMEGFQHPMDMEMAADGSIYLLEYGSDWYFNKNGRIRHLRPGNGNAAPTIAIKETAAGQYEAAASDPESDALTIQWYLTANQKDVSLGEGKTIDLKGKTGEEIRAVATDAKGNRCIERISFQTQVVAPLTMVLEGKPQQAGFGEKINFAITGADDPKSIVVRARYIPPTGHDAGGAAFNEDITKLVTARQCLACHQVDASSVGPRYLDVAMRYRDDTSAAEKLRAKLKAGGSGNWGAIPMPAQVAVSDEESAKIVSAILGLAEGMAEARGTDKGTLTLPPAPAKSEAGGAWEIVAEAPLRTAAKTRIGAK